jgi:hypothetical protein
MFCAMEGGSSGIAEFAIAVPEVMIQLLVDGFGSAMIELSMLCERV